MPGWKCHSVTTLLLSILSLSFWDLQEENLLYSEWDGSFWRWTFTAQERKLRDANSTEVYLGGSSPGLEPCHGSLGGSS